MILKWVVMAGFAATTVLSLGGWVSNAAMLAMLHGTPTQLALRAVGLFVPSLGSVMGFII